MPLATLAPIDGRPFFKHSAIALCLIVALTAAYSWFILLPLALLFSVPVKRPAKLPPDRRPMLTP